VRQLLSDFRKGVAGDGPILLGLIAVWSVQLALLRSQGVDGLGVESYWTNLRLYLVSLLLLGLVVFASRLARQRPASPVGFLISSLASPDLARTISRGLPMLLALVVFMPVFSAMKTAIPLFNSSNWDAVWIGADKAIHGADAWRLLQPVLGFPIVTSALSFAYHAWMLLIYVGGVYFCFIVKNRELRARYFIGFFAIWTVLGVALATGFASVGPCFVGPLLGDHRFDEQMAYLASANEKFPVLVLPVQQMLLAWHAAGTNGLGGGITAMPSMHVAMALLFALSMARVSKRAGLYAWLFFLVILVASVHLAYHYAVDGYVAILVTLVLWAMAGPLARRVARGSEPVREVPGLQPAGLIA
jgi:hypothetical protein